MDSLKLDESMNKALVDGTLKGYLEYLDERKNKKQSMTVSGAYAWTKGNHIDDQVAKIGQEYNLQFKISKAGYSWEYLQFTVNENAESYLVIVKNARRVKKSFEDQKKKANKNHYLSNFSEINEMPLKNKTRNFVLQPEQIQLELNLEEARAVMNRKPLDISQEYSRFYIVTYEIDDRTKNIMSIQLTMPNPETLDLEQIEDLTYLIEQSPFEITSEDLEPIVDEKASDLSIFSGDSNAFGYSIPEEQEEAGNK